MPKYPRTQAEFLPILARIHDRWASLSAVLSISSRRYLVHLRNAFIITIGLSCLAAAWWCKNEFSADKQTAFWLTNRLATVTWDWRAGTARVVAVDLFKARGDFESLLQGVGTLNHLETLSFGNREFSAQDRGRFFTFLNNLPTNIKAIEWNGVTYRMPEMQDEFYTDALLNKVR